MSAFFEFVAILAGMLVLDWAGFVGMKQTVGAFRPWNEGLTYRKTLLPRAWLYPLGAALLEYYILGDSDSIAIISLLVALSPAVLLCMMIVRSRFSSQ